GGRRGAGRSPAGAAAAVPHGRRPSHEARHPVHVTLRVVRGMPSLRRAPLFQTVRNRLAAASRAAFRVVHFTVQRNHLHLLIEAETNRDLSRGVQGLAITIAKRINRLLGRRGRVWNDRYHGRALRTPRETRNALVYVLGNGRKHMQIGTGVDPCSSGPWYSDWETSADPASGPPPIAAPRTRLLRIGWRRNGPIRLSDAP